MAYIIRKLPKTGQTTSYVDYDDGYYEKGSSIDPRFVDNGDGSITDRVTNLMWMKAPRLYVPQSVLASGIGTIVYPLVQNTTYDIGTIFFDSTGYSYCFIVQYHFDWTTYADSTLYSVGEMVEESGYYYICKTQHTSNGLTVADDETNNPGAWEWSGQWYTEPEMALGAVVTITYAGLWASLQGTTPMENYQPSPNDWISMAQACDFLGYNDWRIPNIHELMSICNFETGYVHSPFDLVYTSYYCSSTAVPWGTHCLAGYINGTDGTTYPFDRTAGYPSYVAGIVCRSIN